MTLVRKIKKEILSSRYSIVFLVAVIALTLWTIVRLGLLAYAWNEASPSVVEISMILGVGFIYDITFFLLATLIPCLFIALVPNRLWKASLTTFILISMLHLTCFVMLVGATAEFFFWEEFGVRFNFISVDYLIYRREVIDNIVQSYPVYTLLPMLGVFAAIVVYATRSVWSRAFNSSESLINRLGKVIAIMALAGVIYIIPKDFMLDFAKNTYQRELASNGPYQFIAAFKNNTLDFNLFYQTLPEAEVAQEVRGLVDDPTTAYLSKDPHSLLRWIKKDGEEKRYNVILVSIESLSPKFLTRYGQNRDLTPNLDALTSKSIFYSRLYATGTRTTRGLESLTLSVPPTPGRSIVKRVGQEKGYMSLGSVLNSKGYQSYYLYGGRGYFDNMNAFFSGNGYNIIDQSSVPDNEIGFENAWGMADEYIYAQAISVANSAQKNNKPFFMHIMTTSNHRPYTYPDGRVEIPSGSGRSGAVQYTDWALGVFLQQASRTAWYDNTIFVFVADHQASSAGRVNLPLERYHIPMWIFAPKILHPKEVDTLASQIDVAPTILGLLNMSYKSFFYGKDIATIPSGKGRAFIGNYQYLGLYKGDSMAVLGPKKTIEVSKIKDGRVVGSKKADISYPLVKECISYYQSAAYVFKNKLNSSSLFSTKSN